MNPSRPNPLRRRLSPLALARPLLAGCAVLLASGLLSGCATSHLLEWSAGRPSTFGQPQREKSIYVRSGGTLVAFPVALVWDVATFPFQWIWDSYPYGEENSPGEFQGK